MSHAHHDSPSGQQFHVRYTPFHDPGRRYWSHILTTREDAERELAFYRRSGYDDAQLFVRDVSPWRGDTGPEPACRCGHTKKQHNGSVPEQSGLCGKCGCWGFQKL